MEVKLDYSCLFCAVAWLAKYVKATDVPVQCTPLHGRMAHTRRSSIFLLSVCAFVIFKNRQSRTLFQHESAVKCTVQDQLLDAKLPDAA